MKKIETDILVLGAGWSGLVAADILSRQNRDVVILEKESEIGGLARTFNLKGFRFDIGGHKLCFHESNGISSYIKNLINHNDLITLKRRVKILFNNKYIDYPITLSSLFSLNKKYILNILLDVLQLKRRLQQNNFEEWVKANYGECLYRIYFKDYTEKVWGEPCNKLSVIWADKRIGNLSHLFTNIFMSNGGVKETVRFFYYPRQGMEFLIKSLEQRLKDACQIYKNVQINQFLSRNSKLSSLSFVSNKEEFQISFKKVISSIPIKELTSVLPNIPPNISQQVNNGIKYRSLILASFVINKKLVSNWHWCYFPSKNILFSRIHEPKFWSKDMASEDNTLLCTETFCNYGDLYWNMKDEEIINLVQKALKYTGLLNTKDAILDACVKKIEYAYPLHYDGFEKPLNRVKKFLSSFKNLCLIGRSGTHSYFDMEECLNNTQQVIEKLKKGGDMV